MLIFFKPSLELIFSATSSLLLGCLFIIQPTLTIYVPTIFLHISNNTYRCFNESRIMRLNGYDRSFWEFLFKRFNLFSLSLFPPVESCSDWHLSHSCTPELTFCG